MKPVAILYDPIFQKHNLGSGHPETPDRLQAVLNSLEYTRMDNRFRWVTPEPAEIADIELIHVSNYINWIKNTCESGGAYYPALEGNLVPETWPAALKAAGAVVQACGKVWDGEWRGAFCLVRPPGHHAVRNSAMGFCIFNNIAIGAAWLLEKRKARSILIVDFDVHHGNGTQDAFYLNPQVAFFSTHQFPHYPGSGLDSESGEDEGEGATLNVPLSPGSGDAQFLSAFREKLIPWAAQKKPDMLLVSAGFDAHIDDPLSALKITTKGYGEMGHILHDIAADACQGRWVVTLEGGYDLKALGESAREFLEEMVGS